MFSFRLRIKFFYAFWLAAMACAAFGQQTNPVEKQVSNPITDTPNVNPITNDISPPKPRRPIVAGEGDEVNIEADRNELSGEEGRRVGVYQGNVDVRYGIYRVQADKITFYEERNLIIAEGNVVFDQGNDQRITGTRGEFNYKTKLGYFVDSTGFTNQTNDGTVIYFTADKVERTGLETIMVRNGKLTACEEAVPKWSFTAKNAEVTNNDRVRLKKPAFRVLDIPILKFPYLSIPIRKQDRASGFLTPTVSLSSVRGLRVSNAYYQTLGRSADITFRQDIFSRRGLGFGFDVRTRANSRSYLDFGFWGVKDRIFGAKASPINPDQGGTTFYAQGVHFFPNGFTAAVDVRLFSNLDFRKVFVDGVQQVISPIETSQVFINKSWGSYTFDFLAGARVTSIPNVRIRTRFLPSISVERRPSRLSFWKDLPVYFSWRGSLEGVSRRESADDVDLYRQIVGSEPINSPALGQRLDFNPQIDVPLAYKGWNLTLTGGVRGTYYSNSLNALRQVDGKEIVRGYAQFEADLRAPALARNFYRGKDDRFAFRHVIEPYLVYRNIRGISNFERIILLDYNETSVNTNEIEYGVTNRFFTRRYTTALSREAQKQIAADPKKDPLAIQPYEIFTVTVRGKYFFDPDFGGALVPGRRNQLAPMTSLTAFTFGGYPRRFSPLNLDATYRPQKTIFVNTRLDYGMSENQLRNISATVGLDTRVLKIFQTFYYTRAVTLAPLLAKYADADGREAGTRRGSQWSPSIFAGNRERGFFGGTALFFDFQNTRLRETSPLISSTTTLGYAFDCCSVVLQYRTFNLDIRRERDILFSFRLNGIGSFGTETIGQGIR